MASPDGRNLDEGFILLSRSILYSRTFQNSNILRTWIWCLCKASHDEQNVPVRTGRGETVIKIKRGQFVFGRATAARDLKLPASTIRNHINFLQQAQNLDIKADRHFSVITIRNYEIYQRMENYRGTGKRTTKGQPKDTYKELKELKDNGASPEGEPLEPPKKGKKPKKDPRIKQAIDFFHALVFEKKNIEPIINGRAAGGALKRALNGGGMDLAGVKRVFEWYLTTEKAERHLSIPAALSADSITKYRQWWEKVKWQYGE